MSDLLEHDIRTGLLAPGTKLPPQRELADYLDLNFTTITRAYNICKQKGLIYGTTGKGTFVSPHAAEIVTINTNLPKEGCIHMGFISGLERYNSIVAKAVQTVAQKEYLTSLLDYSDPRGKPHHLAAAQIWLSENGVHTDLEHIALVSGAQNAMPLCLSMLFRPGDCFAVDYYTYPNFIELAKCMHIKLVPIRYDLEGMLPDELERQYASRSIKGIYLMPNCMNPSAIRISLERRKALVSVLRKHGVLLIEDDTHADIPKKSVPPMFSLLPEQTIYISGTAKAFCTGLRAAYIAFGDAYCDRLLNGIYFMNMKTPSLNGEVLTEMILSGAIYDLVKKKHAYAVKLNKTFDEIFPGSNLAGNPCSYHRWLRIHTDKPGKVIEQELKERGVKLYHSYRFLVEGTEEHHYLRIALSSPDSIQQLQRGLTIVRDYIVEQET